MGSITVLSQCPPPDNASSHETDALQLHECALLGTGGEQVPAPSIVLVY